MKRCLKSRTNENDDEYPKTISEKSKMFIVCREIFFVFAILFTAYATLLNSQSKTKRGSPAVPFFHNEDIKDFYQGDLKQLMQDITEVDFSFVMFYAPWDADSQDVKSEFIEVSEFYSSQVYFAAVNCWEPGSECRSTFKDVVYHFPQLVAYIGPQRAIEYKGPQTADHIIKFLHSIMHPLYRINTITDLWRLRYIHDTVLVGHLKFLGNRPEKGFQVLYDTSLRLASRDHERHTAVAIYTHDKVNSRLGVNKTPSFVLYLWNKRIEYVGPLNTDVLMKWILARTQKGLSELNSNTLLPNMKGGAIMVMFTPRHPLSSVIPYYHMIRRIAMNFNICNNGTSSFHEEDFFSFVFQFGRFYKIGYEQDVIDAELQIREKCAKRNKISRESSKSSATASSCSKSFSRVWDNMTCYSSLRFCPNMKLILPSEKYSKRANILIEDKQSSEFLIKLAEEERCSILERTPLPLIPKPSFNLTYLPSCEINSSFSFIALDTEQYSHLANGLGIQLKKIKHRTTVVIFDDEEILKLDTAEVTELSVTNLLIRYFAGERNRSLRSKKDSIYLHHSQSKRSTDPNYVSIIELDTASFHSIALNKSMNVAVLYHSPYCSFCLSVSNLFLTLAHLLRNVNNLLLVRLDGELNDLPWQFTVHSYPSIIFFPARRKSESRIFPQTSPLTFHTLSSFLLSNLKVYERISVLLALCSRWGDDPLLTEEGDKCLQKVRSNSLDIIADTLKDYRLTLLRLKFCSSQIIKVNLKFQLRQLFRYLEYLKIAHLQLASLKSLQLTVKFLEELKNRLLLV